MALITSFYNLAENDRFIHSIKTALACLIGFIAAKYIHFQAMQWIVITTLVIMCGQINVGSVLQKSYMRFLGTVTGSLLAILTLKIFGNNLIINMYVVLIAAIIFSFIATSTKSYNESGTLGAVTVTIILFGTNPSIQTGIERFLEISLGIFIAAIISQFIFPIHASTHLRRNQAMTIKKIRTLYLNLFSNPPSPNDTNPLRNLDEEIIKSLIAQRKLASEARRERFGKSFNLDYFQQSLWCEKEIIRSIIFMFYAYQKIADLPSMRENQALLDTFHQTISHTLQNISDSIEQNNVSNVILNHAGTQLKNNLINLPILSHDERISVDAFIFCMELLLVRLERLIGLLTAGT